MLQHPQVRLCISFTENLAEDNCDCLKVKSYTFVVMQCIVISIRKFKIQNLNFLQSPSQKSIKKTFTFNTRGKTHRFGNYNCERGVVFGLGFIFGYFEAAQRQKFCVKLSSGQDHGHAWYPICIQQLVVIITLVMPDLNTKLSS